MDTIVRFRKKTIDLKPYFEGFPYSSFRFSSSFNRIFYFRIDQQVKLMTHELKTPFIPEKGRQISDLDFGTFSAGNFEYHQQSGKIFFTGDDRNDEIFNIYKFDTFSGERQKVTNEQYIYGKRMIPEFNKIAFLGRKKSDERMLTSFKLLDLETFSVTSLVDDTERWQFTWSQILYSKKYNSFFWSANENGDRNFSNIVECSHDDSRFRILLPDGIKRSMFGLLSMMPDDDTLVYLSDEDGYTNVYAYDLQQRKSRKITAWKKPVSSAVIFKIAGRPFLFAVQDDTVTNTLFILDPYSGKQLYKKTFSAQLGFSLAEHERLFLYRTSISDPLTYEEISFNTLDEPLNPIFTPLITYPKTLLDNIVHGKSESLTYATFDIDEKTCSQRQIHSLLLIPDNLPKEPSERLAIIVAFYGGENIFQKELQILLQAGLIVMSPSVRGSWGFGADFYSLNDKDLGGNEIIDLIYAGRFLADRFGLKESQIGLIGGSHGGYCAMRALTFPESVNGRRESFQWGFAISSFGISNIVDYYHTCNIPDWVIQKAGNPETEYDKLMDRSPVKHAHRATGPLLLIHGENDQRVPVDQSRQMAAAMEKAKKPYRYVEIPGQGHGWLGLNENLTYFKELFEFMNEFV
ncbi:S9 family peptidase [bacterium]|nr:S9 family peptidase [candidate division CSSED10-310 bacterium]